AGEKDPEVDRVGGVHARMVGLHNLSHSRKLLRELLQRRRRVDVRRPGGRLGWQREDDEAEATRRREVPGLRHRRPAGGQGRRRIGSPKAMELYPRELRQRDGVDQLVADEDGHAPSVLAGHDASYLHACPPVSPLDSPAPLVLVKPRLACPLGLALITPASSCYPCWCTARHPRK